MKDGVSVLDWVLRVVDAYKQMNDPKRWQWSLGSPESGLCVCFQHVVLVCKLKAQLSHFIVKQKRNH